MSKRVLAIGVGGTGKAVLLALKERMEETYGELPSTMSLLAIDTDDLRDIDHFAGTRLNPNYDGARSEEFCHITTNDDTTMDTIFAQIASGGMGAYMHWLEHKKLDKKLSPSERDIRGGAQQRRPIGRVAFYLNWAKTSELIIDGISRIYGSAQSNLTDPIAKERNKRQIYIIGSFSGGTGSGIFLDIANLVRKAVDTNPNWNSIDLAGIVVLPDAFSSFTVAMDDPTNLKPNAYSAMRELDRFIRTHDGSTPYMIRYGMDPNSINWSTSQLLDQVYLVDTASTSEERGADLSGNPMHGVFPEVADFIAAHVDNGLGDSLATLRSNAGMHFSKPDGWMYSGFNVRTLIFPVNDVIKSFSYRFLREMMARQFLPIQNERQRALVQQEAQKATEVTFTQSSVGGKVNPTIVQKSFTSTKRMDPEYIDVSWSGLMNLIALSDSVFANDYQDLEQSLAYLSDHLTPSLSDGYRSESANDGYERLLNFAEHFQDDYLGPQIDPDNEDSRFDGQWDAILKRYRKGLRLRLSEALGSYLLTALNARDEKNKVLLPARLQFCRFAMKELQERMKQYRAKLTAEYRELDIDARLRNTNETLRNSISWMNNTRDDGLGLAFIRTPKAIKAQEAYIAAFYEKMELTLHTKLYQTVMDILDSLGAAETDSTGASSIVDVARLELENWEHTLQQVDKIIIGWQREHNANRDMKRKIKVRHYLTDDDYEDELYKQPEHMLTISQRVFGEVRGEKGLKWESTTGEGVLNFKIVSTWSEYANGAEEISRNFYNGIKTLFDVVRNNVNVTDRIAQTSASYQRFVSEVRSINKPFLRYSVTANGKPMFDERYLSYQIDNAQDESRQFFDQVSKSLDSQGFNLVPSSESSVASAIIHLSRGVRLTAVDQFSASEQDYRKKIVNGQESLHLFPEEQNATTYESLVPSLGEPDQQMRPFSPSLVIAMGDEPALRSFTIACAYGLISENTYNDEDTGEPISDLFLNTQYERNGKLQERKLRLSDRKHLRDIDQNFNLLESQGQKHRLYLNALQNFILIAVRKKGIDDQIVQILTRSLKTNNTNIDHIDNPFTYFIREIYQTIELMSLSNHQKLNDYINPFMDGLMSDFKADKTAEIKDLGTVMHFILREEFNRVNS